MEKMEAAGPTITEETHPVAYRMFQKYKAIYETNTDDLYDMENHLLALQNLQQQVTDKIERMKKLSIMKNLIALFEKAIEEKEQMRPFWSTDIHPALHQAELDGMKAKLQELRQEASMSKPVYVCQLPEAEQQTIREKLKRYLRVEGFSEEEIPTELQNAMDSKIDDVDWRAINAILEADRETWYVFPEFGCAVSYDRKYKHIVETPLHDDDTFSTEESCDVSAPDSQEFLDACNKLFGTNFLMNQFSGR